MPDISVLPAKVEEIEKGYNFSEAEYSNALKNEKEDKKENKKEKDAQDKDWRKDYQLSRAVDLVKALSIYTESK